MGCARLAGFVAPDTHRLSAPDLDHLTRTYVETLADYLEDQLFAVTGWTDTTPRNPELQPAP
jgi:hypothetical protein